MYNKFQQKYSKIFTISRYIEENLNSNSFYLSYVTNLIYNNSSRVLDCGFQIKHFAEVKTSEFLCTNLRVIL